MLLILPRRSGAPSDHLPATFKPATNTVPGRPRPCSSPRRAALCAYARPPSDSTSTVAPIAPYRVNLASSASSARRFQPWRCSGPTMGTSSASSSQPSASDPPCLTLPSTSPISDTAVDLIRTCSIVEPSSLLGLHVGILPRPVWSDVVTVVLDGQPASPRCCDSSPLGNTALAVNRAHPTVELLAVCAPHRRLWLVAASWSSSFPHLVPVLYCCVCAELVKTGCWMRQNAKCSATLARCSTKCLDRGTLADHVMRRTRAKLISR